MKALGMAGEVLLWTSIGAMLYLTFIWPFAHSSDPASPAFKAPAMVAFAAFFVALLAALVVRLSARD